MEMSGPELRRIRVERSAVVKLRRLKIRKFRNVEETELSFDDGVNVLLGKNGTGKTTLLHLLSMIFRSDFSAIQGEAFDIEYELRWGDGHSAAIVLTNRVETAPPLLPGLTPAMRFAHEFQVTFGLGAESFTLRGSSGNDTMLGGKALGREDPFRPLFLVMLAVGVEATRPGFLREFLVPRPTPSEGLEFPVSAPNAFRFDEALLAFRAMTPAGAHVEVSAGSPTACTWLQYLSNGMLAHAFLPPAMATSRTPESDEISLTLGLDTHQRLGDWAPLLGFNAVHWKADQPEIAEGGPHRTMKFTRFSFNLERRDGTSVPHDRLSYGQKRLLALLYYLAANQQVVVADEIVNGLHHEWIEAVVRRIGPRQAFLTSQNPLLFDFLDVESGEQASRMFVLCAAEEDEKGATTLTWRNMTVEEGDDFYRAAQTGVQYISEILLQRSLW